MDYDDYKKASILSKVLNSCLKSTNPIKSINDSVKMYRSLYGINKIAFYESKATDLSIAQAIYFIEEKIKNLDIFRRANN